MRKSIIFAVLAAISTTGCKNSSNFDEDCTSGDLSEPTPEIVVWMLVVIACSVGLLFLSLWGDA